MGIDRLEARVRALEKGPAVRQAAPLENAHPDDRYCKARRSIRLWPIPGSSDSDRWGGTGEFIHGTLGVREADVCQDDIESIQRAVDGVEAGIVHDEVIVTFRDKRKRDIVMVNSTNLTGKVAPDGRPTAGTRLEIPPDLKGMFRLLTRFGARLRARHGEGTKRHIKFDDFRGSLVADVKLPGDTEWTRVTPEMARDDLEASLHEENARNQARLAVKLVPWPRERLAMPLSSGRSAATTRPTAGDAQDCNAGKGPRWSGPTQGPSRL